MEGVCVLVLFKSNIRVGVQVGCFFWLVGFLSRKHLMLGIESKTIYLMFFVKAPSFSNCICHSKQNPFIYKFVILLQ